MTLLAVGEEAVDIAVELIKRSQPAERSFKTDRDYATEVDLEIEDRLRQFFERATPGIGFLGEERGHTGSSSRFWCLDPIDGTTNYFRGMPLFASSLALIEDGRASLGIIHLPPMNERYVGAGTTATCNGKVIHASRTSRLDEANVSVGDFATGPDCEKVNGRRLRIIGELAPRVARIRMLGSAAIDLAWLASGTLDAVIMTSNNTWDVAAGVAIAQAAGAELRHADGSPYSIHGPDLVAASDDLNQDMRRFLSVIEA